MKEHTVETKTNGGRERLRPQGRASNGHAAERGGVTFAGVSLSDEPHHQRGAVGALGGTGEGLDAELMSFGLQTQDSG